MSFSLNRASNYTRVAAGASADTDVVGSNATITVYGIVCTNTDSAAETVTLEEGDGSTVIMTIRVEPNSTFESSIQWLAHNGLTVTTPANTSVTVFHSNSGS